MAERRQGDDGDGPSALECMQIGAVDVIGSAVVSSANARAEGRIAEAELMDSALALLGRTMSRVARAEIDRIGAA